MRWISKTPPIYVWATDEWYSEKEDITYVPDMKKQVWVSKDKTVPFVKNTKAMNEAAA